MLDFPRRCKDVCVTHTQDVEQFEIQRLRQFVSTMDSDFLEDASILHSSEASSTCVRMYTGCCVDIYS